MVPQETETDYCCEGHIFRELQGVVCELCTSSMVWAWKVPDDELCLTLISG